VLSLAHVRSSHAGSTGRCNTGVKSLCWGFKLQGLTWSFVGLDEGTNDDYAGRQL